MMSLNGVQSRQFLVVKSWHTFLLVVTLLGSMIFSYATLRSEVSANAQQIEQMNREHARREQVEDLKQDLQRRLERIENKLDQERSVRELEEMQGPRKKH